MGTRSAIVALTCCAGLALGQYTLEWTWTVSDTGNGDGIVEPGEHVLLTLWAEWGGPPPVWYAGSIFDIIGTSGWADGTLLVADGNDVLGQLSNEDGYPQPNNNILTIDTFQLPKFFNPQIWEGNPIPIYWIEWSPDDYSVRTVSGTTANHLNHSVYVDTFGTSVEATPMIEGFVFQVVPAPGVLALGAVCGWFVLPRRRG
ncbi:MAG: hypothetical protein KIS87_14465 [Phycisphaeraceae bacterium]|nr:hypothetical protein [Phycisphaeraceae bacterium]